MEKKTISLKPAAKFDAVIGIDPDADKSGVAFLDVAARKLTCETSKFCDLVDYLKFLKDVENEKESYIVIIEGRWLHAGRAEFHLVVYR